MFLPNLTMTLINMHKLLSPDGRIAALVSEPAKVPKLYTAIDTVARELGIPSNSVALLKLSVLLALPILLH